MNYTMLLAMDIVLTLLHTVVTLFNLLGWIWPRTRKLHLIVISITAFCWLILGLWYGIGYCPLTHWQWIVKEKLGEHNLPDSFITYGLNMLTGLDINPVLVSNATAIAFVLVVLATIYVNFIEKHINRVKVR